MKKLSYVLIGFFVASVSLVQLSYAVEDTEVDVAVINLIDAINKGDYDTALKSTSGNDLEGVKGLLELRDIFGKIEISDSATVEEAKVLSQCPENSDKCIVFGFGGDKFNDPSLGQRYYKLNLDIAGKGFLVASFNIANNNGITEATDSKMVSAVFFILKEGNFGGFTKAINKLIEREKARKQ